MKGGRVLGMSAVLIKRFFIKANQGFILEEDAGGEIKIRYLFSVLYMHLNMLDSRFLAKHLLADYPELSD